MSTTPQYTTATNAMLAGSRPLRGKTTADVMMELDAEITATRKRYSEVAEEEVYRRGIMAGYLQDLLAKMGELKWKVDAD